MEQPEKLRVKAAKETEAGDTVMVDTAMALMVRRQHRRCSIRKPGQLEAAEREELCFRQNYMAVRPTAEITAVVHLMLEVRGEDTVGVGQPLNLMVHIARKADTAIRDAWDSRGG